MDRFSNLNFGKIFMSVVAAMVVVESQRDRVRLRDIQTLTLTRDGWTTARRGSAIPQLRCIGGPCDRVQLYTVQCYNRGWDGRNVQWECKSEMPATFRFGRLAVSCEGYQHPDDEYVLAGSCALEYTIESRVAGGSGPSSNIHPNGHLPPYRKRTDDSFPGFPIILIIAAMILIYFTCLRKTDRNTPGTGGGGPGGDDYPADGFQHPSAPPPPGFRSDFFAGPGGDNSCAGASCAGGTQTRRSGGGGFGSAMPGFLGGMAAGGLMGYMFGSNQTRTRSPRYFEDGGSDWMGSSSGGGGGFRRSSNGDSDGGIQESTGFASTSIR